MFQWLKWLVAGRELAELEQWRSTRSEMAKWFAEFPDAANVLERLREIVAGERTNYGSLVQLRDSMRARRDKGPGPFTATLSAMLPAPGPSPADLDTLAKDWSRPWDSSLPPEPGRVAYRFLSAECGDQS